CDRMDETLVENPQHDVDHQDRDQQQEPQVLHRLLEGLGGALERSAHGIGKHAAREVLDGIDRVSQRYVWLQIERDGYGGKLAIVLDGERSYARLYTRDGLDGD